MKIHGIIYKIQNNINNKIYIGKTTQPISVRIKGHQSSFSNCFYVGAALKKHGIENFSIEVLYNSFSKNDLAEKEIYFTNLFNSLTPNGYNLILGSKFVKGSKTYKKVVRAGKKARGWARVSAINAYNINTGKMYYFPRVKDAIKTTGLSKSIIEKNISFNRISKGYIFSYANQSGSELVKINSHAQRLGDDPTNVDYNSPKSVRVPRLYEFSESEIQHIIELYKTHSIKEVAKITGLNETRCCRLLRKWNVVRSLKDGIKFRESRRNIR